MVNVTVNNNVLSLLNASSLQTTIVQGSLGQQAIIARDQAQEYANQASNSAVAASNSAAQAANSAFYAANSEVYAANSAVAASNSAVQAANSAVQAANSAAYAANSAVAASNSAVQAANSEVYAANSAVAASNSAVQAANSAINAANSAAQAANSAINAANSAAQAANSEVYAANSAVAASNSAINAANSAAQAANSAINAANSAAQAANSATAAANSVINALASELAASVSAAAALASENSSSNSASIANARALDAAASALVASTYSVAAGLDTATKNAQAAASLAQGYAASASSVVTQDLSGVAAQALHRSPNAITAMAIYDTSKDSDGGAWTEKCQHTSWWNEALSGKWLGAQPSEFYARYEGATVGAELLTNNSFDLTTGWSTSTLAIGGGVASLITSSQITLSQSIALTAGRLYRVVLNIRSHAGGSMWVRFTGGTAVNSAVFSGAGRHVFYLTAATSNNNLLLEASGATPQTALVIEDISVREVTALNTASNDYFQLTTDGKFYRLWRNLLTQSAGVASTFTYSGGATLATMTDNQTIGGQTAMKIAFAGQTFVRAGRTISAPALGQSVTVSFDFYNESGIATALILRDSNNTFVAGSVALPTAVGWSRVSLSGTFTSGTGTIGFYIGGDGQTGNVYIKNIQLEYGLAATTYEPKAAEGSISEVFRGSKADFPRLAAIVAEGANVTIYDLTEPGRPMWMRFVGLAARDMLSDGSNVPSGASALAMMNGQLLYGSSGNRGLLQLNFASEASYRYYIYANQYCGPYLGNIAQRNSGAGFSNFGSIVIAHWTVNAIAMTVLPDAPIDPATGLRVPTIAVATGGGMSIIKHNGTVVNSSSTLAANAVVLTPALLEWGVSSSSIQANWLLAKNPGSLGASFAATGANWWKSFGDSNTSYYTQLLAPAGRVRSRASKNSGYGALTLALHNSDATAKGLAAGITGNYNTGWMTGDIRRCFLSDSRVGSVTGGQTISVASFDANWTNNGDGSYTSNGGSGNIKFNVPAGTVLGDFFRARFTITSHVSGTGVSWSTLDGNTFKTALGTYEIVAPWIGAYGQIWLNSTTWSGTISNISVEPAEADRSSKIKGSVITGTLTKAQLATGTSLVGYSGWSASNYLREPYSADLDFGTGGWTASAWVNVPATLPVANFPQVGSELIGSSWSVDGTSWTQSGANLIAVNGASYGAYYSSILVIGKAYKATFEIYEYVSGSLSVRFGNTGTNSVSFNANGTYTVVGQAAGNLIFNFMGGGSFNGKVRNISVVEVGPAIIADRAFSSGPRIRLGVTGIGLLTAEAYDGTTTRTVTTTAAYNTATWLKARVSYSTDGSLVLNVNGREVARTVGTPLNSVSGKYNLLTRSNEFGTSPWQVFGPGVVTSGVSDPDGGSNAFTLTATGNVVVYQQVTGNASTQYMNSVYVRRRTGTGKVYLRYPDNTAYEITSQISSSWQRLYVKGAGGASLATAGVQVETSGDAVDIYKAQLEVIGSGATPTAYQRVGSATDFDFQAPLTIGNSYALDAPFPGSIALLKLGATIPTPEQAQFMYDQEKQLFRAGAQSVLPDSGSIVDMAYDDATDRWIAVSAANESYWTGLVRNNVIATPAGRYTKVVAGSGVELTARSTTNIGVDITMPAYGLREELVKRAEAAARLGKELAILDYVGGFTGNTTTGSTALTSVAGLSIPTSYIGATISGTGIPAGATIVAVSGTTIYISAAATANGSAVNISFLDFKLPAGMEVKEVVAAGAVKQEGSTKDWQRLYDGFVETVRFGAAPGVSAWVQVKAQRISA